MKNDLDFYKMAKRTLHEMFKDPEERKELEKEKGLHFDHDLEE